MISDGTLAKLIDDYSLVAVPVDRIEYGPVTWDSIQPASVDVRLSHDLTLYDRENDRNVDLRDLTRFPQAEYWVLPGECVLGSLVERVRVPADMVGWIEGKSSLGRKFLKVHSAGFIDPGFHGDLTLEIKNESSRWGFPLKPGMLIAQLRFAYLDATAVRPYGTEGLASHYQMQIGTTEAR